MGTNVSNKSAEAIGQCRLCLTPGVRLCRSHVVPKWAYRRSRSPGISDLAYVTEGAVTLTTKQVAKRLLCRACEDRFMTVESRMAPLFKLEGGSLHLQALLSDQVSGGQAWRVGDFPITDLCYLALSVLWRTQVSLAGTAVDLGDDLEAIRLYLLGDIPLLPHIEMMASLLAPTAPSALPDMFRTFNLPTTDDDGNASMHRLYLCGVLFVFWSGPRRDDVDLHGLLWGREPLVLRLENEGVVEYLARSLVDAVPKGRLSRR